MTARTPRRAAWDTSSCALRRSPSKITGRSAAQSSRMRCRSALILPEYTRPSGKSCFSATAWRFGLSHSSTNWAEKPLRTAETTRASKDKPWQLGGRRVAAKGFGRGLLALGAADRDRALATLEALMTTNEGGATSILEGRRPMRLRPMLKRSGRTRNVWRKERRASDRHSDEERTGGTLHMRAESRPVVLSGWRNG
eukprot:scaffold5760_cov220-Pinguiococcus_pyrenoidosus.AAC.1